MKIKSKEKKKCKCSCKKEGKENVGEIRRERKKRVSRKIKVEMGDKKSRELKGKKEVSRLIKKERERK